MQNNGRMNRGRISVDIGAEWRAHAPAIPAGLTPMGTVSRGGFVAVLCRDAHGQYWAVGAGKPDLLPTIKVQSAIGAQATGIDGPSSRQAGAGDAQIDFRYPGSLDP